VGLEPLLPRERARARASVLAAQLVVGADVEARHLLVHLDGGWVEAVLQRQILEGTKGKVDRGKENEMEKEN
jgi:hypothetical protein